MKIEFTKEEHYIELLPSITIGWKPFRFYIGWLFWNIIIN